MKKLIIIAPGGSLRNSKLGSKIDDFNYVCRVNHGAYRVKGHEEDVGSKTTHCALGFEYVQIKTWLKVIPEDLFKDKIWVCLSQQSVFDRSPQMRLSLKRAEFLKQKNITHYEYMQLDAELWLRKTMGYHEQPQLQYELKEKNHITSGLKAIAWGIYKAKKENLDLYIAGFDMYESGYYYTKKPYKKGDGYHKISHEKKVIQEFINNGLVKKL